MFSLRTPNLDLSRQPADGAFHALCRLLAAAVLVAVTVILFMFVTVERSQACRGENNPTVSFAPTATQGIAKQQIIENRLAATSSAIKFAIKRIACCGSGHCGGFACVGSCCPACSAGVVITGWTDIQNFSLHVDIPPPQMHVSSIELDTQFRPPRTIL